MSKKNNPRMLIFALISVVVILGVTLLAVVLNPKNENTGDGVAKLTLESNRHAFGDVSMANGLVSHTFKITNEGTADLKLSKISTSCMCTTAILEVDGERSPKFGMAGHGTNPAFWSTKLKPSQSGNLQVTFDPNAHGPDAVGPITRTITMYSNDDGQSNTKQIFTFTANVIR